MSDCLLLVFFHVLKQLYAKLQYKRYLNIVKMMTTWNKKLSKPTQFFLLQFSTNLLKYLTKPVLALKSQLLAAAHSTSNTQGLGYIWSYQNTFSCAQLFLLWNSSVFPLLLFEQICSLERSVNIRWPGHKFLVLSTNIYDHIIPYIFKYTLINVFFSL